MKKIVSFLMIVALMVSALTFAGCSGGSNGDYYVNSDFISENTLDVMYETSSKSIGWGEYQKEVDDLGSDAMEFHAGNISSAHSKEEFEKGVEAFKAKLDVLKSEYALGYSGESGDYIKIKIDDSRLGLPVFAILNAYSEGACKVISEMGEVDVYAGDLTYELGADGEYVISVKTKPSSGDRTEIKEFIDSNEGKTLYLKIGELTFSHAVIDGSFNEETIVFKGLDFISSTANEADYEFILELAQYTVKNLGLGLYTMAFPIEIENNETYKVPYVTPMDEYIISIITGLYEDATFERQGVYNRITIRFNINPNDISDEACLDRVAEAYAACSFDDGAYTSISFTWPGEEGSYLNDYVIFTKDEGKMVCSGCSDSIESLVNAHSVIGAYVED